MFVRATLTGRGKIPQLVIQEEADSSGLLFGVTVALLNPATIPQA
jgi:hypothetical protein